MREAECSWKSCGLPPGGGRKQRLWFAETAWAGVRVGGIFVKELGGTVGALAGSCAQGMATWLLRFGVLESSEEKCDESLVLVGTDSE